MLAPDGLRVPFTCVTGQWFGPLLVGCEAPSPELQIDIGNRMFGYNGNFPGLPAEGLLGAARLAPGGAAPSGRSSRPDGRLSTRRCAPRPLGVPLGAIPAAAGRRRPRFVFLSGVRII